MPVPATCLSLEANCDLTVCSAPPLCALPNSARLRGQKFPPFKDHLLSLEENKSNPLKYWSAYFLRNTRNEAQSKPTLF